MDIKEPAIKKEDILILKDENFNADHVCIVTGAGTGIGRATAVAAAAALLVGRIGANLYLAPALRN